MSSLGLLLVEYLFHEELRRSVLPERHVFDGLQVPAREEVAKS